MSFGEQAQVSYRLTSGGKRRDVLSVANTHHHHELLSKQSQRPSQRPSDPITTSQMSDEIPNTPPLLPSLRFEIPEAALVLRMSRAALYIRISSGAIRAQKDGSRTYITRAELERYVASCDLTPWRGNANHEAKQLRR